MEVDPEEPAAGMETASPAPAMGTAPAAAQIPVMLHLSESETEDGSSSDDDSSGDGDAPEDPSAELDYRKVFQVGSGAGKAAALPPVHPNNVRPTPEEFSILTAFCVDKMSLEGVTKETQMSVSGFGEAARRAAKMTHITSIPLHPGLKPLIDEAWKEPHKAGYTIPALEGAPVIQEMAGFVSGGIPRVEEAFADMVQAGAADWARRKGADGLPLAIPITDPGREEIRDGLNKMTQLLAQQASTASFLMMVTDVLMTETHGCLFDTHQAFSVEQHEQHYLALLSMLKILACQAESAAAGIGHAVSLTRKLWLRHAESLGVQLPERAKQVLRDSPVSPDGLLGAVWTDTVERQGRLMEERETVGCLKRAARPSKPAYTGVPSSKRTGFGVQLAVNRKSKAKNKSGSQKRRVRSSAKRASNVPTAPARSGSTTTAHPATAAPQGAAAAGRAVGGRGKAGSRGRGKPHQKQD